MTCIKTEKKIIIEMIQEYKEIEKYIEEQTFQLQTRLDGNRYRRGILQEYLEQEMNGESRRNEDNKS